MSIYNNLIFSYLENALLEKFVALEDDLITVLLEAYNDRDCDLKLE